MHKRILFLFLALSFLIIPNAIADRNIPTVKSFSADTLVQRGDAKIYWIDYVVTTNGGGFTIYDSDGGSLLPETTKTEGSQATALNGGHLDFSDKPIEFSTGIYLDVTTCSVIIAYE